MKMTEKKKIVLEYLEGKDFCSPTEIGMKAFGIHYDRASSKMSSTCKALVSDGLIERNTRGHYRLKRA